MVDALGSLRVIRYFWVEVWFFFFRVELVVSSFFRVVVVLEVYAIVVDFDVL